MTTPEQRARQRINELPGAAGWQLQDYDQVNLGAAPGVAVCEFSLLRGVADYMLLVDRKMIGAVEAEPSGTPLGALDEFSISRP